MCILAIGKVQKSSNLYYRNENIIVALHRKGNMAASPGVYFLAVLLLLVCRYADAGKAFFVLLKTEQFSPKKSDDFLLAGPGYYSGAPIRSLEMLQTGENGMGCEGRVPDFPYELQDEYMAVIDEKVTLCKESTKKALFHP